MENTFEKAQMFIRALNENRSKRWVGLAHIFTLFSGLQQKQNPKTNLLKFDYPLH